MSTVTVETSHEYLTPEDAEQRAAAVAALERVKADGELLLPQLRETERKARLRLERTQHAANEAATALAEAQRALEMRERELSRRHEKASAWIEATADPAIDNFVRELREEYQELGQSFRPVDRVTSRTSAGDMVVRVTAQTKANAEHNVRLTQRMTAIDEAIRQAKALKRDPAANVGEAIEQLRNTLPAIDPEN